MKRALLDISMHLIVSLVVSALVYLNTSNIIYACIVLAAGVLLDVDHLFDYFVYFKNKFNLLDFLTVKYLKSKKVYLFLHSWELIFAILLVGISIASNELILLFLSSSLHLGIDNVQRKNPFIYFFIYRCFKKFDAVCLLPENKGRFY